MRKKINIIKILSFIVLLLIFYSSCRYKEGPYFSLRGVWERVRQQKYIVEYTVNGADSMQYLRDKVFECNNFRIFFMDRCSSTEELRGVGAGDADYTDADTCKSVYGFCIGFYKNYKYIDIPLLAHPFNLTSTWLILRLTKDEMWLRAERETFGKKTYELKFKSN